MRLFFLVIFSPLLFACNQPLTISYAPFISLLLVNELLGEFHRELQAETGCKVEYSLSNNFESFLLDVFRKKSQMTLVPTAYSTVLQRTGYQVIASERSHVRREFVIISNKLSGIQTIDDLAGRKIQVISQLSSSGDYLLELLEQKGLMASVKVHYGGTYDVMVLSVLKNQVDAAVIIPEYFNAVDKRLRERKIKVIGTIRVNSDVDLLAVNIDDKTIPIIRKALRHTPIEWGDPLTSERGSKNLRMLLDKKYKQFLRLQKNK